MKTGPAAFRGPARTEDANTRAAPIVCPDGTSSGVPISIEMTSMSTRRQEPAANWDNEYHIASETGIQRKKTDQSELSS